MSEWIKLSERKPERDGYVYVTNTKRGVHCYEAFYFAGYDYFQLNDPRIFNPPPIEVTHWVYLPTPPKGDE